MGLGKRAVDNANERLRNFRIRSARHRELPSSAPPISDAVRLPLCSAPSRGCGGLCSYYSCALGTGVEPIIPYRERAVGQGSVHAIPQVDSRDIKNARFACLGVLL